MSCLGFVSCDNKENLPQRSADVYLRYYGMSYNEAGTSVAATSDGGAIMVGSTSSNTDGNNTDIYVVKVDKQGVVEFEKSFGGDGDDAGKKVRVLENGNYLIAGDLHNGSDYDITFIELDEEGQTVREFSYPMVSSGYNERVKDIDFANNYIYGIGYTDSSRSNSATDISDLLLFRINYLTGDVTEDYIPGNDKQEEGVSIKAFSTGDAIIFWNREFVGKNHLEAWLWFVESSGVTGVQDLFIFNTGINASSGAEAFAKGMILTNDGDVVFLSTIYRGGKKGLLLHKYNKTLMDGVDDQLWSKEMYFSEDVDAVAVYEQNDRNLVISMTASTSSAEDDIAIMKLDQWGNQVFSNPSYFGGVLDDEAGEIIEDGNGNLLFTGTITFENKQKATLIKTNPSGGLFVD